jgi:hypothetical protein
MVAGAGFGTLVDISPGDYLGSVQGWKSGDRDRGSPATAA